MERDLSETKQSAPSKSTVKADEITIRLAGDSGDGMQLIGQELSLSSALMGNDIGTYPDFPAEIRAPIGTMAGVSGFQLRFGNHKIFTPGDQVDALVAMNPAALKVAIDTLKKQGILIVNQDSFDEKGLKLSEYKSNPLEDGSLSGFQVICVSISQLTQKALKESSLSFRAKDRCKNYFALGLLTWLYERDNQQAEQSIEKKFSKKPELAEANKLAFKAGFAFGEASELFRSRYSVSKAPLERGLYRNISGNEALAYGLIAGSHLAGVKPLYCSYPITPASDLLHFLAAMDKESITTFQAEDEIAAATAAIGASFAGGLGIAGTSGPGMNLKMESINLAIMGELPLVIVDVQRAGPSTGMPTKTEQSDLLLSLFGRNGESPIVVLSASNPSDCFERAMIACQLAITYMTPVIILSEAFVANGSEPWKIPDLLSFKPTETQHHLNKGGSNGESSGENKGERFAPYKRSATTLSRPWAIPGQSGFEHVIGGLEKLETAGTVSYDGKNHDHMVRLRHEKIKRIENVIPELEVHGPDRGKLLVLGWAGNYGTIRSACESLEKEQVKVSWAHLHFLNPFPKNLGDVLNRFEKVLVPEINLGQLAFVLQATYLKKIFSYTSICGKPIATELLKQEIKKLL